MSEEDEGLFNEEGVLIVGLPKMRRCMRVYLHRDAYLLSCAKATPAKVIIIIESEVKGMEDVIILSIQCSKNDRPLILRWLDLEIEHLCL